MRHILIASNAPDFLADFLAGLAGDDTRLRFAPTAEAAEEAVRIAPPALCVVDGELPDAGPFELVGRLMRVNAMVHTAVISELSDKAFHEAGEGLGILLRLPPRPDADAARDLLAALAAVS